MYDVGLKQLVKLVTVCSTTFATGQAVHILENTKSKSDKRVALQTCLDTLKKFRSCDSDLDVVLNAQIEKAMKT